MEKQWKDIKESKVFVVVVVLVSFCLCGTLKLGKPWNVPEGNPT
jgi:hypothetical protein